MKSLKDVKPGDKIFVLNLNRGYLKEPQIEILTANKVGILYIYTDYDKYKKSNGEAVESSLDIKAFATLEEAETGAHGRWRADRSKRDCQGLRGPRG